VDAAGREFPLRLEFRPSAFTRHPELKNTLRATVHLRPAAGSTLVDVGELAPCKPEHMNEPRWSSLDAEQRQEAANCVSHWESYNMGHEMDPQRFAWGPAAECLLASFTPHEWSSAQWHAAAVTATQSAMSDPKLEGEPAGMPSGSRNIWSDMRPRVAFGDLHSQDAPDETIGAEQLPEAMQKDTRAQLEHVLYAAYRLAMPHPQQLSMFQQQQPAAVRQHFSVAALRHCFDSAPVQSALSSPLHMPSDVLGLIAEYAPVELPYVPLAAGPAKRAALLQAGGAEAATELADMYDSLDSSPFYWGQSRRQQRAVQVALYAPLPELTLTEVCAELQVSLAALAHMDAWTADTQVKVARERLEKLTHTRAHEWKQMEQWPQTAALRSAAQEAVLEATLAALGARTPQEAHAAWGRAYDAVKPAIAALAAACRGEAQDVQVTEAEAEDADEYPAALLFAPAVAQLLNTSIERAMPVGLRYPTPLRR